jgi:hypothetical protein
VILKKQDIVQNMAIFSPKGEEICDQFFCIFAKAFTKENANHSKSGVTCHSLPMEIDS